MRLQKAGLLAKAAGAALGLAVIAVAAYAGERASPNDVARVLAGMQPAGESAAAKLARTPGWQQHARFFEAAWDKLQQRQLSKIRRWSEQHLGERRGALFYMFSGPDFLYAHAFFPHASTYVLSGLEPVGRIPEVSERSQWSLADLRSSLNTSLSYGFFITADMRTRLQYGEFAGTLPILYVFIARSGKTIQDVGLIRLDRDGEVRPAEAASRNRAVDGVKITFSAPGEPVQTLYYFRTDLSDGGVKNSGFLRFCDNLGGGDALLKSASYLLHGQGFSRVRAFLLEHSEFIVQDDSGIPIRYLERSDWELKPFGRYLGPIEIFQHMYQPKLRDLFHRRAERLEFGIGYRWRAYESNLLLAVKKRLTAGD